jgi:5-formyltetrahydrofolate cyclo-ligase
MSVSPDTQKIIRAKAREGRQSLSPEYRAKASDNISNYLIFNVLNEKSRKIAVYLASFEEVNLQKVIEWGLAQGKKLYAPKISVEGNLEFILMTSETPIEIGKFGLQEPTEMGSEKISPQDFDAHDVVLVPLVAFDAELNRVGMGGGFYDRGFSHCKAEGKNSPLLIGCAFECQKVDQIIPNPWDVRLDEVVTERNPLRP